MRSPVTGREPAWTRRGERTMTGTVKSLVTWLPIAVAVALVISFCARPHPVEPLAGGEFLRPEPPSFQPVLVPFGSASLRGRIVDERGAPVAELPVYARSGEIARWAYTDPNGRFELARLLDEELELLVLALGRPTQSFRLRPGPDEQELRLGPERPAATYLPDLPRSDLAGSLARALEGSTAGFEVLLEPLDPPNVLQGAVPVRAEVDGQGAFAFAQLAHARYRVRVLPAWAQGGSWPDLAAAESSVLEHDGTRPALSIELGDGALSGRVEHEDGSPLAGALVLLHPSGDEGRAFPAAASDALGAYRVGDLPAGSYEVEIRAGEDVKRFGAVEVERREVAALPAVRLVVRGSAPSSESKP